MTLIGTEPSQQEAPVVETEAVPVDVASVETEGTQEQAETPPVVEAESPEPETPPEGAPEAYEDFTAPEGVELDTGLLDNVREYGKANNLTQAQAQAIVDLGVKQAEAFRSAQQKLADDMRTEWVETVKKDPDLGGANFDQTRTLAARAVSAYSTPALLQFLEDTKLGDHPEVVRFFAKVGKDISEDQVVKPGKPASERSPAAALWPSSPN
jgi:hypothetical protein